MAETKDLARAMPSWLGEQGQNLFQEIKAVCREAEEAGQKLTKLSIGQPIGPALLSARKKAAECIMHEEDCWHEYQDNTFLPFAGWTEAFCQAHVKKTLSTFGDKIAYMPITGIKPMLGLIPLACNLRDNLVGVQSMTDPGYPIPKTWCGYSGIAHQPFVTEPANYFLPEIERGPEMQLAMFNLPHNPSGQIATCDYWRMVCAYCEKKRIRIFNDAAYILLSHSVDSCVLADVAPEFPNLSWMEAYSVSKEIGNGTGWRIGAVNGSPDFIGDLRTIKGNTDSGFNAALAAGALHALQNDQQMIDSIRFKYQTRLAVLSETLAVSGMKIALEPKAGFFLLCRAPQVSFGEKMADAREFNYSMIKNTGIVGVHFHPYIRYAVVGPVENWMDRITEGFGKAAPEYFN